MTKVRAAKRSAFSESLYEILRRFQNGEIAGNSTAVGKLGQPLTQVYDEILAAHKRVYEPEVHRVRRQP